MPDFPTPQTSVKNTCKFCNEALHAHLPAALAVCSAISCRNRWNAERAEQAHNKSAEKERILNRRIEELLDQICRWKRFDSSDVTIVRTPHTGATMAQRSHEFDSFVSHLHGLSDLVPCDAVSNQDPESEEPCEESSLAPQFTAPNDPLATDLPAPLLAAACGGCRGNCCRTGLENNAFIDRYTFNKVKSRNPHLSEADIVGRYLGFLPSRSQQGSCLYHSEQGCTLPREFRADICNQFYCFGLLDYAAVLASEPQAHSPVLVLAIAKHEIHAASLLEATAKGIQREDVGHMMPEKDDSLSWD